MPQHQNLFPGDSLFEKIARAVCRAGVLPRKELYESWEVAKRVRRKYRGCRVLDFACGHGLLAYIMLILDDSSENALAVDHSIPASAYKVADQLIEKWPRLEGRIVYKQGMIEDVIVEKSDIVVSAHACGILTDVIIGRAVESCAKLAVLPCCHDTKVSETSNLEGWMDKPLAIDTVRALKLKQAGYKIFTQVIPSEITPKNRLLMGEFAGTWK